MAEIYETILQTLANLCNSTIIEIYGDKIRVSHGFEYCQLLGYIAAIQRSENKRQSRMTLPFIFNFIRFSGTNAFYGIQNAVVLSQI